jgi:hypothetical protein
MLFGSFARPGTPGLTSSTAHRAARCHSLPGPPGRVTTPLLPARVAQQGRQRRGCNRALFDEMLRRGQDADTGPFALAGEALRSDGCGCRGRHRDREEPPGISFQPHCTPVQPRTRRGLHLHQGPSTQLLEKGSAFLAELMPGLTSAILRGAGIAQPRSHRRNWWMRWRKIVLPQCAPGRWGHSLRLTSPDGDLEPLWRLSQASGAALNAGGRAGRWSMQCVPVLRWTYRGSLEDGATLRYRPREWRGLTLAC